MALTPISSQIIADVGISMGDEGKGRLVYELIDELSNSKGGNSPVSMVMKVNGGANSGHTAGGLKLNLLPAAILADSVPCLALGCGTVADPRKLWWEIKPLEKAGYSVCERLLIDERTQVSDLTHRLLDLGWEYYRANVLQESARGTTGRGITPAYGDEVGQRQIFFNDFKGGKEPYRLKLARRIDRALAIIRYACRVSEEAWDEFFETLTVAEQRANTESVESGIFSSEEFDFRRFKGKEPFSLNEKLILDTYWKAGSELAPNIGDAREAALKTLHNGKTIIGEFGQSYWLDKRHGFSPNVTASHTYTPEFFQSAGLPVQPIHTIGVCKAYDTKVGTHVFITEMPDAHPLSRKLRQLEYGTSTGRQRMVGWFDAVEKGDSLRYGGFQDLMINKLDALSYSDDWQGGELMVCAAYRDANGTLYKGVPRDDSLRKKLQPVFLQLPGWSEDITQVRRFADLPGNAKRFVATLVKSIFDIAYRDGHRPSPLPNLRYIGVGPDRSQIINDVPDTEALLKLG